MHRFPSSLLCLVIAWFLANQPQGFVVQFLAWTKAASRFSHQEQLLGELRATLVAAAQAPADLKNLAATERERPMNPKPIVPAPAFSLAKIDLALAGGFELLPPPARRLERTGMVFVPVARPRDVPVPVPRTMG